MSKYGENIYRRKDGRWEARYIFTRLPNGKAKYKSVYGKTHDIAKEKQLAGMLALAKEEASSCDLTVKELLVQYLAQTDVKTSTRERYWFMLERHIIPYFGKTPASKLTTKELSSFLLHLKKNGRLDGKGGLSAKTVRDMAVLLKTLLRFAQREYHCILPPILLLYVWSTAGSTNDMNNQYIMLTLILCTELEIYLSL